MWRQLQEDCERRQDPEAYAAWKTAQQQARSARWREQMFGGGQRDGGGGGGEGGDGADGGWSTDSEDGGGGGAPCALQW